jgi:predicted DNA-binding protein (UPF0251 family)
MPEISKASLRPVPFKEIPLTTRNLEDVLYAEEMAKIVREKVERSERPNVPRLDPNLSPAEREKAILALQSPAMQKIMLETDEEKAKRLSDLSTVSFEKAAVDPALAKELAHTVATGGILDPDKVAELVKPRKISPEEYAHAEAIRRRPKNTDGQSELSGTTKETKEKAASAFTCSPPADLTPNQKAQVQHLTAIKALQLTAQMEVPKPSFWSKLKARLFHSKDATAMDDGGTQGPLKKDGLTYYSPGAWKDRHPGHKK